MTLMSRGSLSARASAEVPMAATDPVVSSIAMADGYSSTRPRPSTQTSVLTVPRSIATPALLSMLGHLWSALGALRTALSGYHTMTKETGFMVKARRQLHGERRQRPHGER